jgi:hypothetical protein
VSEDPHPAESIKSAFLERVRDPFVFSFLVALAGWNWRFVYVIVHGGPNAAETMAAAHHELPNCFIGVPLVAAVAFVIVHPWVRGTVALARTHADVAANNWRRRATERRELMSLDEWGAHPQYTEMIRRADRLKAATQSALERLHACWVARRPAAGGTVTIEKLAQPQQFEGFAVLTPRGLLKADEGTTGSDTPPQMICYVLDCLPVCARAIVASGSSHVPMPETSADVGGFALLKDGRQVPFPSGDAPPATARAWIRRIDNVWAIFEVQRPP